MICWGQFYFKTVKFMKSNSNKLTASLIQLAFFPPKPVLASKSCQKRILKDVKWEKEK